MDLKLFKTIPNKIDRGISMIVYADPGVGKTTLASTLPPKETLIVNTEAGLGPLLGTGHIEFNVLKALQNRGDDNLVPVIEEMYEYLLMHSHPFQNVVVDNVSELEQQLLLSLTKKRGKNTPDLREYGEASFTMKKWVEMFRDLIFKNINVVFNAWEFPVEIKNVEGSIVTRTYPMVGKKIAPQICGIVDCVFHLEVNDKSGKRWLRTGPSDQYVTKTQFKGLDMIGEPPDLMYIIEKIYAYDYKSEKKEEEKVLL